MPSGPDSFVAHPAYSTELGRARELLLAHPGRWRVIYHYDGDGIASASSALRMLRRLGDAVHLTPLQGVERGRMASLLGATRGPVMVVDTGAAWPDLYAAHPAPVVILDHHSYPGPSPPELPGHVAFVNPLDWGVDGMRGLSAASLTWLFSILVDPVNWDNAPYGLSGAIADRQHVNGFESVNRALLDGAIERRVVRPRRGLPLHGATTAEALARSIDPFLRGLSGRPEEATGFLTGLGVDPKRPPAQLDDTETRALREALMSRLARQGVRPEFCAAVDQERYDLPGLGLDAETLSNYQNAAGRIGEPGVGVALALGDPKALERVRAAEEAWRSGILAGLRRLEDGGVNSRKALQWFESPDTTLAGTQAGLAMNYLLDPAKPTFVFSSHDRSLKVSGRGTLWLVGQGLDLSEALRSAASSVGGEGGGHRVASGATIPSDTRDRFLDEVDRIVAAQLPHLSEGR